MLRSIQATTIGAIALLAAITVNPCEAEVVKKEFGKTADGKPVHMFHVTNASGEDAELEGELIEDSTPSA